VIGNGGASGLPGKSGQGKWAPLKIPHRKYRKRGRMQDALTRPKLSFLLLPEFACVFHSLLARRFGQILPSGTGPFCQDIRQTLSKRQQKIFTIEGDRLRHVQKRVKKKDRHREKLGVDSSMIFVLPRQRTSKEKTETNGGSKRADNLFDMQR
jgi:hypothetical protein